jgi:NAD/NADP transhydrogenase beta subunit
MHSILIRFIAGATDLMAVFLAMSCLAMLIAILTTVFFVASFTISGTSFTIDTGLAILGFLLRKVWMASLLQILALYNCIGGGAACVIGALVMLANTSNGTNRLPETLIGALIGGISVSGSLIAWTKLDRVDNEQMHKWDRQAISVVVAAMILVIAGCIVLTTHNGGDPLIVTPELVFGLIGYTLFFGALIPLLMRTEYMPIVISAHNALAGFAIGLEGVAIRSPTLMIAGIIVGTGRVIMTLLMMNYETGNIPRSRQERSTSFLKDEAKIVYNAADPPQGI